MSANRDVEPRPGTPAMTIAMHPATVERFPDLDFEPYHRVLVQHGYAPEGGDEYGKCRVWRDGGRLRHVATFRDSCDFEGYPQVHLRRLDLFDLRGRMVSVNLAWDSDDENDPLSPELLDAALTILDNAARS